MLTGEDGKLYTRIFVSLLHCLIQSTIHLNSNCIELVRAVKMDAIKLTFFSILESSNFARFRRSRILTIVLFKFVDQIDVFLASVFLKSGIEMFKW